MECVKDEGSPNSSGLAMVGSKESLFSHFQSAFGERGWKRESERREIGGSGRGKGSEVIPVKQELFA